MSLATDLVREALAGRYRRLPTAFEVRRTAGGYSVIAEMLGDEHTLCVTSRLDANAIAAALAEVCHSSVGTVGASADLARGARPRRRGTAQ